MIYELYIGRSRTGVSVRPDPKYPNMFGIHSAEGKISDMVNLSRAKDAAVSWARSTEERKVGGISKDIHWKAIDKAPLSPGLAKNRSRVPDSLPARKTVVRAS